MSLCQVASSGSGASQVLVAPVLQDVQAVLSSSVEALGVVAIDAGMLSLPNSCCTCNVLRHMYHSCSVVRLCSSAKLMSHPIALPGIVPYLHTVRCGVLLLPQYSCWSKCSFLAICRCAALQGIKHIYGQIAGLQGPQTLTCSSYRHLAPCSLCDYFQVFQML